MSITSGQVTAHEISQLGLRVRDAGQRELGHVLQIVAGFVAENRLDLLVPRLETIAANCLKGCKTMGFSVQVNSDYFTNFDPAMINLPGRQPDRPGDSGPAIPVS